jgi:hypothetical protein
MWSVEVGKRPWCAYAGGLKWSLLVSLVIEEMYFFENVLRDS